MKEFAISRIFLLFILFNVYLLKLYSFKIFPLRISKPWAVKSVEENKNTFSKIQHLQSSSLSHAELLFKDDLFTSSTEKDLFLKSASPSLDGNLQLLELLSEAKVRRLANVEILKLPPNPAYFYVRPFDYRFCPDILYIRPVYKSLFKKIDSIPSASINLVGSEGTSKSTFQFYMIYEYLKAIHGKNFIFFHS